VYASIFLSLGLAAAPADEAKKPADGKTPEKLDDVVITGKAEDIVGRAQSSSQGQANNEELSQRPTLRRGELLEVVPGMIITQHAGGGKANQYFLRGYNLDHGTDFRLTLDGMPINHRTHAHGQGYADLNFLIPELTEGLDYYKGPYFAQEGDLATAGGADYHSYHSFPGMASITVGAHDYYRFMASDSAKVGEGILSIGGEYGHENGPWKRPNNFEHFNLASRYHLGDDENYLDFSLMAYRGEWMSSDQIPERAVKDGSLDRFGSINPSTGGTSSRQSFNVNWQKVEGNQTTHLDAWIGRYTLDLFSDFTYFLNDPVNGDQFEQQDKRYFGGLNLWRRYDYDISGLESQTTIGVQNQNDVIRGIGLYNTKDRQRLSTVRKDDVYVGSYSLYADHETQMNDWLRAGGGLRGDFFDFSVDSDRRENSGDRTAGILSPKGRLIFGPWADTELYLNGGLGFHSNDARGVNSHIDPATGDPVDPADPLVRTAGAEIGLRTKAIPDVIATTSLWALRSDSELVYVGDAGAVEPSGASERWGIETTAYYRLQDWLSFDGEYAWANARFTDAEPGMDEVPNSIEHSASAGFTLGEKEGWLAGLRARYFSSRPLEESGTHMSADSLIFNGRIGYRKKNWELDLDVLNILDAGDKDIEYYYESRLPGEAAGIEDTHYHPMEPRQLRLTFTYRW